MTDSIEQFIESPHLGCNFIATASLSGSAGDQAIPALAETAADDTLAASGNVQSVKWRRGNDTFMFDFGTRPP